jgi:ATP-binding cassette subfamily F protein 3
MDITSKETLENLILNYTGTVIFVSHDRYFTNKIANKLLIFENGETKVFEGTYKEYADPNTKKIEEVTKKIAAKPKPEKIEYPIDYDDPKEVDPILSMSPYMLGKERNKTENQLKKLEEKSADAESKLKQLNEDFVNPDIASDFVKLMEIQAEMEKTQSQIDKFAEDWMTLSDKLSLITSILDKPKEDDENASNN